MTKTKNPGKFQPFMSFSKLALAFALTSINQLTFPMKKPPFEASPKREKEGRGGCPLSSNLFSQQLYFRSILNLRSFSILIEILETSWFSSRNLGGLKGWLAPLTASLMMPYRSPPFHFKYEGARSVSLGSFFFFPPLRLEMGDIPCGAVRCGDHDGDGRS